MRSAIKAALDAKPDWENMRWEDRASIFSEGSRFDFRRYRAMTNAMTMLGQSKNIFSG